ncbi:hypothetical protein LINGRAHAP2_LOCUS15178 [Linum grandiflorum]
MGHFWYSKRLEQWLVSFNCQHLLMFIQYSMYHS